MSSLVLLNSEGVVARKLQLISLPDNYVVPEGMTISWRIDVQVSSRDPLVSFRRQEPVEAYFCLGNARGRICRSEVKQYDQDNCLGTMRYGFRTLTVTVQGTSAREVMELRDHIMRLIDSGVSWGVSNDLNPKPKIGLLRRIFGVSK